MTIAEDILSDVQLIDLTHRDAQFARAELIDKIDSAISAAEARAAQLEAERDEARKQLEQAQKQIAELEATLKDIATAPYENQPNDGDEWEKEYYLRGLHH